MSSITVSYGNFLETCPWALSWAHSTNVSISFKRAETGTSLVAQWLRSCLPMQGTRVQALVREDPTCSGAAKPLRHNYWACALEPASHNYWARAPRVLTLRELRVLNSLKGTRWGQAGLRRNKNWLHMWQVSYPNGNRSCPGGPSTWDIV